MADDFVNNVTDLCKQKNWKSIIDKYHDYPERNKLLWVFPSEDNLLFLIQCLKELNIDKIISVGCGSGLLEWIITTATGQHVVGIEIDKAWWRCKYAPPTFIPLLFTGHILEKEVNILLSDTASALLFCYFNNRPAFDDYLKGFLGNVLIIIGPHGKGVHTDPKPFDDVPTPWRLFKWQEVRNTKDYIAIYCKD